MSANVNERTPLIGNVCNPNAADLSSFPVYEQIHKIYNLVSEVVNMPLTAQQINDAPYLQPIMEELDDMFTDIPDPSMVYVLLLNRLEFLRERDSSLVSRSINQSRGDICEILAIRMMRHQCNLGIKMATPTSRSPGLLEMARSLVGGFHAFQGASNEVLQRVKQREGYTARIMNEGGGKSNALELAILSDARRFIKSSSTQRVIQAIYEGKIVYTSSSFLEILPDRWKQHEIRLFNVETAPLLDHYRLRVPIYRGYIDLAVFISLFIYFIVLILEHPSREKDIPVSAITFNEWGFTFFALGFALDRIASMLEHGYRVYSAGLTNGLDMSCILIFLASFILRVHSVLANSVDSFNQSYAILSCAACLMFPRLAFALISNNLLILSLRAMLADFFWLMGIAIFCFTGFVFALSHLSAGQYSATRISEWLVFIWFGLDGTGIDKSPSFHGYLGPLLFVSYAALSNTLIVSVLVAILSSTYNNVANDAVAEDMFRKAVRTFEGVKAGSLFDYVPPLNLIALLVMWPISLITTPRWFHKINVLATRILSCPFLLVIALYEKRVNAVAPIYDLITSFKTRLISLLPTKWAQKLSLLEGAHWECEAVFEYDPNDEKTDEEDDDEVEYEGDAGDLLTSNPQKARTSKDRMRISDLMEAGLLRTSPTPGTSTPKETSSRLVSLDDSLPDADGQESNAFPPIILATSPSSVTSEPDMFNEPAPAEKRRAHFDTSALERRPTNAAYLERKQARRRHTSLGSETDVDAGIKSDIVVPSFAKHHSPISELYYPVAGDPFGLRRRKSSRATPYLAPVVEPPNDIEKERAELREMLNRMSLLLNKLEKTVNAKGKTVEDTTEDENDDNDEKDETSVD